MGSGNPVEPFVGAEFGGHAFAGSFAEFSVGELGQVWHRTVR
jgi:hypothetical protein